MRNISYAQLKFGGEQELTYHINRDTDCLDLEQGVTHIADTRYRCTFYHHIIRFDCLNGELFDGEEFYSSRRISMLDENIKKVS